jgi:hypothetical protein
MLGWFGRKPKIANGTIPLEDATFAGNGRSALNAEKNVALLQAPLDRYLYSQALKAKGHNSLMYADDHRPPRFHIVAPDFQVLVRISDLTVIAGEARPAEIAKALAWAQTHQEMLALKWAELNERD